jgi:fructose-1,6-bisphosphatase/inositol monophosphatase family enzyme
VPVRVRAPQRTPPVAALGTHFLSPERRARVHARAQAGLDVTPVPRCAAESYPRLVLGNDDIALFQRILPWDHAAGILFLCEAGGHVTHWNRQPYRVGGSGQGVLAAGSEELWRTAADVLLAAEAGLVETEVCAS